MRRRGIYIKVKEIKESIRSIIEICMIIFAFFFPKLVNVTKVIEICFKNTEINFDNIKYYLMLQAGNWFLGIILAVWILNRIRRFNEDKMFNTMNIYHDYPYAWYWFCAKILGYKKCNMQRVPIYMQFKLTLNDTFGEYYVGEDSDYIVNDDEQIKIERLNCNMAINEINLILADTYPIAKEQIPIDKRKLMTIELSRNQGDYNRYFSSSYIKTIVNEVRGLPDNVRNINIFATTNPKHTFKIASSVFKMADRGNVDKVLVFQQNKDGTRRFERKGRPVI